MSLNRREGGRAEVLLRRALWARGLRFRKHYSALPGKPDVVLVRQRVCVFCDGDFWHGRRWTRLRQDLGRRANGSYWVAKIESNRTRDRRVRAALRKLGWKVLSFWETEILRDPAQSAAKIAAAARLR